METSMDRTVDSHVGASAVFDGGKQWGIPHQWGHWSTPMAYREILHGNSRKRTEEHWWPLGRYRWWRGRLRIRKNVEYQKWRRWKTRREVRQCLSVQLGHCRLSRSRCVSSRAVWWDRLLDHSSMEEDAELGVLEIPAGDEKHGGNGAAGKVVSERGEEDGEENPRESRGEDARGVQGNKSGTTGWGCDWRLSSQVDNFEDGKRDKGDGGQVLSWWHEKSQDCSGEILEDERSWQRHPRSLEQIQAKMSGGNAAGREVRNVGCWVQWRGREGLEEWTDSPHGGRRHKGQNWGLRRMAVQVTTGPEDVESLGRHVWGSRQVDQQMGRRRSTLGDGKVWRGKEAVEDVTPELEDQINVVNYKSFIDYAEDAAIEVKRLVEANFAKVINKQRAVEKFGEGTVSRIALLVKQKEDLTVKRRIIVDMRRSGGNDRATCPERIILPRIQDVTKMGQDMARRCTEVEEATRNYRENQRDKDPVVAQLIAFDLKDAFCHFGLCKEELKHSLAPLDDENFVLFSAMLFGFRSAPLIMGRLSAAIGRLWQAMMEPYEAQLQVYIDDVLMMARGTEKEIHSLIAWGSTRWRPLEWTSHWRREREVQCWNGLEWRYCWVGGQINPLVNWPTPSQGRPSTR